MALDIHIDELQTQIDIVDGDALLSGAALERIVRAVLRSIEERGLQVRTRERDLDLRSIRDQQRDDEAW